MNSEEIEMLLIIVNFIPIDLFTNLKKINNTNQILSKVLAQFIIKLKIKIKAKIKIDNRFLIKKFFILHKKDNLNNIQAHTKIKVLKKSLNFQ